MDEMQLACLSMRPVPIAVAGAKPAMRTTAESGRLKRRVRKVIKAS